LAFFVCCSHLDSYLHSVH
jgi:hypothetical protein